MKKKELISALESIEKSLIDIQKQTKDSGEFVKQEFKNQTKNLAIHWFEDIQIILSRFGIQDPISAKYSDLFGELLEISRKKSVRKSTYLNIVNQILEKFSVDNIIPVHKATGEISTASHLGKILFGVSSEEREYLEEALNCANYSLLRAAVILGWCAAVHRMQKKIEQLGFTQFNEKAKEMKQENKGRFKRFKKEFHVSTLSDFRATVFDKDMLWVLEYWELITSNQHDRLLACYILRNNAAHPGGLPVTEENLASFFSDLRVIVFENPKFIIQ